MLFRSHAGVSGTAENRTRVLPPAAAEDTTTPRSRVTRCSRWRYEPFASGQWGSAAPGGVSMACTMQVSVCKTTSCLQTAGSNRGLLVWHGSVQHAPYRWITVGDTAGHDTATARQKILIGLPLYLIVPLLRHQRLSRGPAMWRLRPSRCT